MILEPAINQEFYSESDDYEMPQDDLAMFFYIKLNEINFNFTEFFHKQENITEKINQKEGEDTKENNNSEKQIAKEEIKDENYKDVQNDENASNISTPLKNNSNNLRTSNLIGEDIINSQIQTKSHMIMNKLKKISQRANISKDKETIEDLQFIIKTMSENNLNEPEMLNVKNDNNLLKNIDSNNYNPSEDFLAKYSRRESMKIMELDFAKTKSRRGTFYNMSE